MSIDKLLALLPPERAHSRALSASQWKDAEAKLSLRFPDDFKRFVEIYGPGAIDGFLWVLSPFSDNKNINFEVSRYLCDAYLEMKETFPEQYPRTVYPSPGGILPWAITDNGDPISWITEGEPNSWHVVVHDKTQSEEFVYAGNMTKFLADLISKQLEVPIFPKDFPRAAPKYEAIEESGNY